MTATGAPVIGVVAHAHSISRPFGRLPVTGASTAYVEGIAESGGRPLLLPGSYAAGMLDLVDGLVLTGGGDVDPVHYGGDRARARDVDAARDLDELAVVRAAAAGRVPVLGVCRGAQVLAVAFGGRLVDGVDHERPADGHDVDLGVGSRLHALLGPRVRTSALHRQAIAHTGPHWRPTAWSADGTIEGIEPAAGAWAAVGVQWHPEAAWTDELDDATGPALLGWLVEAARAAACSGRTHHTPAGEGLGRDRRDAGR